MSRLEALSSTAFHAIDALEWTVYTCLSMAGVTL